jgi:hypothetical protein
LSKYTCSKDKIAKDNKRLIMHRKTEQEEDGSGIVMRFDALQKKGSQRRRENN